MSGKVKYPFAYPREQDFTFTDGGGVLEKLSRLSHPPLMTEAEAQTAESRGSEEPEIIFEGRKRAKEETGTSDS